MENNLSFQHHRFEKKEKETKCLSNYVDDVTKKCNKTCDISPEISELPSRDEYYFLKFSTICILPQVYLIQGRESNKSAISNSF